MAQARFISFLLLVAVSPCAADCAEEGVCDGVDLVMLQARKKGKKTGYKKNVSEVDDAIQAASHKFGMTELSLLVGGETGISLSAGIPLTKENMYRTTHTAGTLESRVLHNSDGSLTQTLVSATAIKREVWDTYAGITDWNGPWIVEYTFSWSDMGGSNSYTHLYLNTNIDSFSDGGTTGETGGRTFKITPGESTSGRLMRCPVSSMTLIKVPSGSCQMGQYDYLMCDSADVAALRAKFVAGDQIKVVVQRLATGEVNAKLFSSDGLEWEVQTTASIGMSDASNVMPVNIYQQYSTFTMHSVRGGVQALIDPTVVGDPHVKNIRGQKFELRKAGPHKMLAVPRGAGMDDALLFVDGFVEAEAGPCSATFLKQIVIGGQWLDGTPALTLSADSSLSGDARGIGLKVGNSSTLTAQEFLARVPPSLIKVVVPEKVLAAPAKVNRHTTSMAMAVNLRSHVSVQVSWVTERTPDNALANSLWLSVSGISAIRESIGGLLGDDDFHDVSMPDPTCARKGSSLLSGTVGRVMATASLDFGGKEAM